MAIYTVHEPPLRRYDTRGRPRPFRVRARWLSWAAFLFGPLWMLRHRMWLALVLYVALMAVVHVGLGRLGLPNEMAFVVGLLIALLIGFEAGTLRRFKLARRGWSNVGVIVGDDREMAEQRFFDAWVRETPCRTRSRLHRRRAAPVTCSPVPAAGSVAVSVAIVDYGSGNLHSAAKAFERAARESCHPEPIVVTSDPEAVARADRLVLPGVGAFADCRRGLDAIPGMVEALDTRVRVQGRPFLGICVGMQLMAERGREYEVVEGLAGSRAKSTASRPPTRA